MPGSNRVYTTATVANANVVTTNETVAQVSPALSVTQDGDPIQVTGTVSFTTGTATTAVTVRCRRGNGITGTVVGTAEVDTLAAAVSAPISVDFLDFPGAVAGQVYSITVQQTAATGNGTVNSAVTEWTVGS